MNNAAMMFIKYKTECTSIAVFIEIIHNNSVGNAHSMVCRLVFTIYGWFGGVENYPTHFSKT